MAERKSKRSAKVEKNAKRVAAKAAKPHKTAPRSQSPKPALLAGGNPHNMTSEIVIQSSPRPGISTVKTMTLAH